MTTAAVWIFVKICAFVRSAFYSTAWIGDII
jgi:hypothetical protein